jgi:hypothetical protein
VYYDVCQVFRIPFRTDYGTEVQTLEYVCDLGVIDDIGWGTVDGKKLRFRGFHLVTGADVSPDGKYILIKNHNNISAPYSWVLLWEREGDESVAETLTNRTPQPLYCYEYEWQGEAICWLDSTTFYTTSDSDGEPPIYKYTKKTQSIEAATSEAGRWTKVFVGNTLYLRSRDGLYTLDGRRVQ